MTLALIILTVVVQVGYLIAIFVTLWFYSKPINYIEDPEKFRVRTATKDLPDIVLLYPVLNELEETMKTTFIAMEAADYPEHKKRIIAIPNHDDQDSIDSLRRLQLEFPWLEVWSVPPTSDDTWDKVFDDWQSNPKAYWWHEGAHAYDRNLPAKKTRQLVWATYQLADSMPNGTLLSYIDADSIIPKDYWYSAASGAKEFDVIQSINITGNALATWPASFHAMDHVGWDATLYPHMTANGKHPYYVLGKGLFYKLDQLLHLGTFHPWLTIEDPEVGLRLWSNGKRMGMMHSPLIEEVPATWSNGFTQRKRWMAGFFQTLGPPLKRIGMRRRDRWRARINIIPVLSLAINPLGLLAAISVTCVQAFTSIALPSWVHLLSLATLAIAVPLLIFRWLRAWILMKYVMTTSERIRYMIRVNPVFTFFYSIWWIGPIIRGFVMAILDQGLKWERTVKVDANHQLIRGRQEGGTH